MRSFLGAAISVWLGLSLAIAANAQGSSEPVIVVELFTSQGCSSCPPADEFMAELVRQDAVVPLALHVDYWDYIGWADRFAMPQFTDRQKAYARAIGSRTIYTPQMIVGGQERVEGFRPMQVTELIRRHMREARSVDLQIRRDGDQLRITAQALVPLKGEVRVQLVRYRPSETVEIKRGENAGKTITYHNIVTSWQVLGTWSGAHPLSLDTRAEGDDPVVVILQSDGPAAIVAAARLP